MDENTRTFSSRDGASREYAADGVTLLKIDGVSVSSIEENTGGIAAQTAPAKPEKRKKEG